MQVISRVEAEWYTRYIARSKAECYIEDKFTTALCYNPIIPRDGAECYKPIILQNMSSTMVSHLPI